MWFITTYEPVSFISLKTSTATSTGGKSLLLPTPFAFKMALLDVIIQNAGIEQGKRSWNTIRGGQMAIQGPAWITVNNTFTKILKPNRNVATDPDTGLVSVMIRTIAFREYVQWQGPLQIAFQINEMDAGNWERWLTQIHYLGRRGGFLQAIEAPQEEEELPVDFTLLTESLNGSFSLDGTLQMMDDCDPMLSFDKIDIYSNQNIRLGSDRILRHIILPYRMQRSSRGYTLYQRID
jgi:CRISPR/Cas system-associated protein Cas5 (RAMP superfamily)